jgi:hypothetical protein
VSNNWSAPTTRDEIGRRAGGRRHYNHWRQAVRDLRRLMVVGLLARYPLRRRGTVRAIARALGVHPATVCRDLQALLREHGRCPHCGQLSPLGVGEGGPGLVDQVLANYQADFLAGNWQWAGRGPLPRRTGGGDSSEPAGP